MLHPDAEDKTKNLSDYAKAPENKKGVKYTFIKVTGCDYFKPGDCGSCVFPCLDFSFFIPI